MPSPPARSLVNSELTTMSLAWNTMRRSSRSLPSSTRLSTAAAATSLNVLHIGKRSLPRCSTFAPEPVSSTATPSRPPLSNSMRARSAASVSGKPAAPADPREASSSPPARPRRSQNPPCRHIPSVRRKLRRRNVAATTLAKSGTLRGEIVTLLRLLGGGRLQHRRPARDLALHIGLERRGRPLRLGRDRAAQRRRCAAARPDRPAPCRARRRACATTGAGCLSARRCRPRCSSDS